MTREHSNFKMIKTTIDSHFCIKLTNMLPCSSTILSSEFNKFWYSKILRIWNRIKTLRIRFLTHKSFILKFYIERLIKHNSQIFLIFFKYLIKIRIIWPLNIDKNYSAFAVHDLAVYMVFAANNYCLALHHMNSPNFGEA